MAWSISEDEENYNGTHDTADAAIEEGRQCGYEEFWVGECVTPTSPEMIWNAEDWLRDVWCHTDYAGEWAEGAVDASKDELEELETKVREVISAWLDRHGLRPTHWNIDPKTVRKIKAEQQIQGRGPET